MRRLTAAALLLFASQGPAAAQNGVGYTNPFQPGWSQAAPDRFAPGASQRMIPPNPAAPSGQLPSDSTLNLGRETCVQGICPPVGSAYTPGLIYGTSAPQNDTTNGGAQGSYGTVAPGIGNSPNTYGGSTPTGPGTGGVRRGLGTAGPQNGSGPRLSNPIGNGPQNEYGTYGPQSP